MSDCKLWKDKEEFLSSQEDGRKFLQDSYYHCPVGVGKDEAHIRNLIATCVSPEQMSDPDLTQKLLKAMVAVYNLGRRRPDPC